MNWNLWSRQIDAVVRLELKRYVLARRWVGMYLLALAPIALFLMRATAIEQPNESLPLAEIYATFYQLFVLRFGIFLCCAVVFTQMVRGEILEKTQHFYLLAPVRRTILVAGKYIAGVVTTSALFGMCTAATFVLLYLPSPLFSSFFLSGNGIPHLARYLIVTMLAAIGYGAVFMVAGILFKNPSIPTTIFLGWESLSFAFPAFLQNLSLTHHFQSLLPLSVDRGIFAVLTEGSSPLVSIPAVLVLTAAALTLAGWLLGRSEVTYSTD